MKHDNRTSSARCSNCDGRGYNTRCYDEVGSNDFGGEGYARRGLIEKVPCSRCQQTPDLVSTSDPKPITQCIDSEEKCIDSAREPEGGMEKLIHRIERVMKDCDELKTDRMVFPTAEMRLLLAHNAELQAKLKIAEKALEILAKLGNGDKNGNSTGNTIVQNALSAISPSL